MTDQIKQACEELNRNMNQYIGRALNDGDFSALVKDVKPKLAKVFEVPEENITFDAKKVAYDIATPEGNHVVLRFYL